MIVVKLGGSVITYKKEGSPALRKDLVRELLRVLSSRDVILVHGAGSYALPATGCKTKRCIFSILRRMQVKMAKDLLDLSPEDVFYLDAGSLVREAKDRIVLDTRAVKEVMESGYIPLLGASIAVKKTPFILSGDDVALSLASSFNTTTLFLTDVDGVLGADGRFIDELRSLEDFQDLGALEYDTTGGMGEKIRKIFLYGVKSFIMNGLRPDQVKEFLEGKKVRGTWVIPG